MNAIVTVVIPEEIEDIITHFYIQRLKVDRDATRDHIVIEALKHYMEKYGDSCG